MAKAKTKTLKAETQVAKDGKKGKVEPEGVTLTAEELANLRVYYRKGQEFWDSVFEMFSALRAVIGAVDARREGHIQEEFEGILRSFTFEGGIANILRLCVDSTYCKYESFEYAEMDLHDRVSDLLREPTEKERSE